MTKTWIVKNKLVILISSIAMLFLSGCKLPEVSSGDPGALVEFDPRRINEILGEELASVSLDQIEEGQVVTYESNYRIENSSTVTKALEIRREVIVSDFESNPAIVVFDELRKLYDRLGNVVDQKESQPGWEIPYTAIEPTSLLGLMNDDDEPVTFVKYYNLKHSKKVIAAPEATKQKAGCGGLEACQITGVELSYTAHLMNGNSVRDRVGYSVFVSKDIPPIFTQDQSGGLMPIAYECFRQLITDTYVKQCTVLRDIQR